MRLFWGGSWQETQEIAGGFLGSRIKNASQLSQDWNTFCEQPGEDSQEIYPCKQRITIGAKNITITHKMITEPNFIIFELFWVIPALWLPNRFVSGINLSH